MKNYHSVLVLFSALVFGAGGCALTEFYQPPAADAANATMVGSALRYAQVRDDQATFVYAIDGRVTEYQKYGVDEPVAVKPGMRYIEVACTKGRWQGRVDFHLELKPGGEYIVKSYIDKSKLGAFRGQAELWIEDKSTGQRVTDKMITSIDAPEVEFRPMLQQTIPTVDR
jgi:hypothetical protein